MNSWSRRSFLKSVGAAAVALPCFRLLESSALGQTASPLRLAIFANPHGAQYPFWRPQGADTAFTMDYANSVLAPFEPLKQKVLVLDGVDYSVLGDEGQHVGYASALTGVAVPAGGQTLPSNPSIDQYLAGSALGAVTKFRSLQIANGETNDYKYGVSYLGTKDADGNNAQAPMLNNPYWFYNQVFANFSAPGSAPDPAIAQQLVRKQSRLDYMQKDLSRLRGRLANSEKSKLDEHLQALRDIEAQLTAGSGQATAACSKPPLPTVTCGDPSDGGISAAQCATLSNPDLFWTSPKVSTIDNNDQLRNVMVDLLAQTFACDLTRFATFQMAISGSDDAMPYVDPSLSAASLSAAGFGGDPHTMVHGTSCNATSLNGIGRMQSYFAKVVARFAQALDAIPEGDGTVLDHTCILWINEHGDAQNHGYANVPLMLIGGANGYFRTGRYLTYDSAPHNQLLVSVLNAFGLADQSYGSSNYSGPLPGLT